MDTRRTLAASLVVLVVGACQAALPSTLPSPTSLQPAATPSASPVVVPTIVPASPPPTPSPVTPSPLPVVTPTPSGIAAAFADWRRADLPDPTSDPFRRGTPSDVIWFEDRYIAVGATGECCADSDPSKSQGRIWTSRDGDAWRLLDRDPTFRHASLHRLSTDGERLVLAGWYADPIPGELPEGVPAIWVSLDGRTWTRAREPAPSRVAATGGGFAGARVVDGPDGVTTRFMFSTDGLAWSFVSDLLAIDLRGFAADASGRVVAVGMRRTTLGDEVVAYRSVDGRVWQGPSTLVENGFARGLSAAEGGFHAVGWLTLSGPDATSRDVETIWHSSDGVGWSALPLVVGDEEGLDDIHAIGATIVATGTTSIEGLSNAMVWVSTDGRRQWGRVPDQAAFGGINNELRAVIETANGLLAVGSRWDRQIGDLVPVVWWSSR